MLKSHHIAPKSICRLFYLRMESKGMEADNNLPCTLRSCQRADEKQAVSQEVFPTFHRPPLVSEHNPIYFCIR